MEDVISAMAHLLRKHNGIDNHYSLTGSMIERLLGRKMTTAEKAAFAQGWSSEYIGIHNETKPLRSF